VQLYQQTPYVLQPISLISDFLLNLPSVTQEQVYETSLTIKPRSDGEKKKSVRKMFNVFAGAKEVDEDASAGSVKSTGLNKSGLKEEKNNILLF
jgi:hypothetical protein